MEAASAVVTAVGIVRAAGQVAIALHEYTSAVKNAHTSRTKLLDQIRLMAAAEMAIQGAVQGSPRSSRDPELQALIDGWFAEDALPARCKRELEALSGWLERQVTDKKRLKKWGRMIVWPVKEDKIQVAIQAFEVYMPYFHCIVSMESLSIVQSIATRNRDVDLDVAKRELLMWLDGFDCTDKHENTCTQRQKTTGEWLFKEQLYIDWRKYSKMFFWLHGKAGAGKSVLASLVIDSLFGGPTSDEAIAYFYCDFRNPRCTTAMEVFRSLARQLLFKSKHDWLPSFHDLTTRKEQGIGPPTNLGILLDLLQRVAELHERPTIVVDALDECDDLSDLLDGLTKLSRGRCRLFVTSRPLHVITQAFSGLPSISLNDRVGAMRHDMYFHVKAELESRSRLKILRQDVKDEIQDALVKKADGMFRWVQCQLDRLNSCCSLGDVREVLGTLPETLYETYDQMLRAIDKKPFGTRIARRALTWLVAALRPLSLSELTEALSIHSDRPEWESTHAPIHKNIVLEVLGSLVAFQKHGTITLSHYSVKEYLTSSTIAHSTFFVHPPSASLELARVSISSIILFGGEWKSATDNGWLGLPVYGVDYALSHLAKCDSDHNESLVGLLVALQDHVSTHRHIYTRLEWFHKWMSTVPQLALSIIARFGHLSMLRYYLDHHPTQAMQEDNTLVYATLYSDVPRVQLLLDKGFDVNLESFVYKGSKQRKVSPLIAAARNITPEYQQGLVELLLTKGCVVPRDVIHTILLCDLGISCKPAVVRVLLENGADPKYLDRRRRSCLYLVLEAREMPLDNRLEIAHMQYATGCDPMAPDDRGLSPLHLSIQSLSCEFVQWFVQCGFPLPTDASLYAAPSFLWTRIDADNFLSMLDFLVAHGALADAQDANGCNALHLVSGHIYGFDDTSVEHVVRVLVAHGCDINGLNEAGETPLEVAMSSRLSLGALGAFLDQGAELPLDVCAVRQCLVSHVCTVE